MNKLQELDIVLRLYEQNFRNLHWNSVGLEFNDSHKNITTEYYEMLSDSVDVIAETLCMFDISPVNFLESAEFIKNSGSTYLLVDSSKKYTKQDVCEAADVMLKDICKLLAAVIEKLTSPLNAGIKSNLEDMLYKYSLEARYLNARRLG